jgi:hypothetical protein
MMRGDHTIDNGIVHRLMPVYNREYREYLLEKETRANESNKNGSTIVVHMEPSKSDIVPVCANE